MSVKMLKTADVAEMLGVSASTLAVWRCRGRDGPPYTKVGSRVRYSLEGVEDWIERNTFNSTSQADQAGAGGER